MSGHGAWSSWQSSPGQSAPQTGHWQPQGVPEYQQDKRKPLQLLATTLHKIRNLSASNEEKTLEIKMN